MTVTVWYRFTKYDDDDNDDDSNNDTMFMALPGGGSRIGCAENAGPENAGPIIRECCERALQWLALSSSCLRSANGSITASWTLFSSSMQTTQDAPDAGGRNRRILPVPVC